MMSSSSRPGDQVRKQSSPPVITPASPHLPQLRLPPTRHSSQPLSLVTRPSPAVSSSASSTSSSSVTESQTSESAAERSEPVSLVTKSPERAENLSKRPADTDPVSKPSRPELGSIRVRPAEALSPAAGQPPLKKPRESPSPRQQRPPSSSPLPQSTPSPRPPSSSLPALPPGFPPGLATSLAAGLLPPAAASLASPYSPYTSPYLSSLGAGLGAGLGAVAGGVPGSAAPCTDPLCRDPACPTYQLRAAQAAQMLALTGYPAYPGYPLPAALPGLPPSMMIPGFPGAPPAVPGLPPSLLAPPVPPVTSSSSSTLPTVGGASQFMCSWMQGRDFCGRRFNSSEELMSHLRTHTANMGDTAPPVSAAAGSPSSALALLQAQAAQLRSQSSPAPASTVSPPSLSSPDPRLHPYLRPPGLTPPTAPPHPALNPMLASLYGSPRQLPGLS